MSELLTSKQVAQFVTDGFLRFDGLVPADLSERALADLTEDRVLNTFPNMHKHPAGQRPGDPLRNMWPDAKGIREVLELPSIGGIITSLVGDDPRYDHHASHVTAPGGRSQHWHADSILDLRLNFDIQLFFFFHDTPQEMGGTLILPGSHYRRVNESDAARFQNFVGQIQMVCPAGTLLVCHHGIWHCAQPNRSDRKRWMFKLRLNPGTPQKLTWDTSDLDDPEVYSILQKSHGWYGNDIRFEVVRRIQQWRFLTGDDSFDVAHWLGRLENVPG